MIKLVLLYVFLIQCFIIITLGQESTFLVPILNYTFDEGALNKSSLRIGHRTYDCQDFKKAYACIMKCLELGYHIAESNAKCKCTCFKDYVKEKYFSGVQAGWKIPTTSIPPWAVPIINESFVDGSQDVYATENNNYIDIQQGDYDNHEIHEGESDKEVDQEEPEEDEAGEDEAGEDEADEGESGEDEAGEDEAGEGEAGEYETAEDETGENEAGKDEADEDGDKEEPGEPEAEENDEVEGDAEKEDINEGEPEEHKAHEDDAEKEKGDEAGTGKQEESKEEQVDVEEPEEADEGEPGAE